MVDDKFLPVSLARYTPRFHLPSAVPTDRTSSSSLLLLFVGARVSRTDFRRLPPQRVTFIRRTRPSAPKYVKLRRGVNSSADKAIIRYVPTIDALWADRSRILNNTIPPSVIRKWRARLNGSLR